MPIQGNFDSEFVLRDLAEILHKENCSCVISGRCGVRLCHRRGIIDLWELYNSSPDLLYGAAIADKVVGKGAAAIMVSAGVGEVHADVISSQALMLFEKYGVRVEFERLVPDIRNRAGTGLCPVETLCRPCSTAEECLPMIEKFINDIKRENAAS